MSRHFDKYDVMMKVLELIEQDAAAQAGGPTKKRVTMITNIFQREDGVVQQQIGKEEAVVEGNKFENVNQSVIATQGSLAEGIISVQARHGEEIADAIRTLEEALKGRPAEKLTAEQRKEALDLLSEIAQQAVKPTPSKSVLRSLGKTLLSVVENIEPLSAACAVVWSVLERLWA